MQGCGRQSFQVSAACATFVLLRNLLRGNDVGMSSLASPYEIWFEAQLLADRDRIPCSKEKPRRRAGVLYAALAV